MKKRTIDHGYIHETPFSELVYSKGYDQQRLANESGLSYTTVQWLCTGKTTNPRLETLRMVAKTLGVELYDVVKRMEC